MPARSMKEDDPLEDFARREITLNGVGKRVYVAGSGPPVIVVSEMQKYLSGGGLNTRTALRPPNANELDIVWVTRWVRPSFGT